MFRILFVLDVMDGVVVHAIKGERHRYEPVEKFSRICSSSGILDVFETVKPREVYVADLDRIMNRPSDNLSLISLIPVPVMLDYGVRSVDDFKEVYQRVEHVVVGTETAPLHLFEELTDHDFVVSIDTRNGNLLSQSDMCVREMCDFLSSLGVKCCILLDISMVGTHRGINEKLVYDVMDVLDSQLLYGGGVRSMEDIERLREIGVDGVLISTAVHLGHIPLDVVRGGHW